MSNSSDENSFGTIVPIKEIDNRLELLHMEFAVTEKPKFNELTMFQLWSQNKDLRVKILLCQKEYIQENEEKNKYHRQYIDILRLSDHMKKRYENKIQILNIEIDNAQKKADDLLDKLKSANEFIDQLINEMKVKNEQ